MSEGPIAEASVSIDTSVPRVWRALTDRELTGRYPGGAVAETDWTPGSRVSWRGTGEGGAGDDRGEVLEVEPMKRLVVSRLGGPRAPGNRQRVSYELEPDGARTTLRLSQDNNENDAAARAAAKKWQAVLEGLKEVAESAQ